MSVDFFLIGVHRPRLIAIRTLRHWLAFLFCHACFSPGCGCNSHLVILSLFGVVQHQASWICRSIMFDTGLEIERVSWIARDAEVVESTKIDFIFNTLNSGWNASRQLRCCQSGEIILYSK